MGRSYKPRSFGTHDGAFHADEVTACALLLAFDLIDPTLILRTRDQAALDQCEYMCDVGGVYDPANKLFDHHQSTYMGSLSSAGMILKYLLDQKIVQENEYGLLYGSLVRGVDAHDNGQDPQLPGICTFSHVVSNYSPISREASEAEYDAAFYAAVVFARGHIDRLLARQRYIQSCRDQVAECMAEYKDCLIFERNIPWMEIFFELDGERHPATFIIMPSGPYWKLRGIPPNYQERMAVRVPLPEEWAGLLDDDLRVKTGIDGAVFCHKGRFISVWKTKEDALTALELIKKKR